uniref:Uncharacterized protein n=1 Tax=Rhizophora mucronata TaxID=61149 RepID=A0A2P2MLX2_RHIMU
MISPKNQAQPEIPTFSLELYEKALILASILDMLETIMGYNNRRIAPAGNTILPQSDISDFHYSVFLVSQKTNIHNLQCVPQNKI